MKKTFKKSRNKKSIIFGLLLCISLISTILLWKYSGSENNNGNIASQNQEESEQQIDDNDREDGVNVSEDPYKDYVSKTINDYKASLQEEKNNNYKQSVSIIESFEKPLAGTIKREYSLDELIYFESIQEWRTHSGIDIAPSGSLIVMAAYDGTVEKISTNTPMGVEITVKHNEDLSTVYSCMSSASIKVGDVVKKGDKIGTLGIVENIETAGEPHLHFEILIKGESYNPGQCYFPKGN